VVSLPKAGDVNRSTRRGFLGSLAAMAAAAVVAPAAGALLPGQIVTPDVLIAGMRIVSYYNENGELVVEVQNDGDASQDALITMWGSGSKNVWSANGGNYRWSGITLV